MKIIKGSSRWVLLTKNFAIKFPALYSYRNFLNGLLANMQEKEFYSIESIQYKLCPILFTLPLGLLVIMKKALPVTKDNFPLQTLRDFCTGNDVHIPAEIKYDSFGSINNQLVAIDYGS